jgi:hypothetical protein
MAIKMNSLRALLLLLLAMVYVPCQINGNELQNRLKQRLSSAVLEEEAKRKPTPYPTKRTPWPTGSTSVGWLFWFDQAYFTRKAVPKKAVCPKPPKLHDGVSQEGYQSSGCVLNPTVGSYPPLEYITTVPAASQFNSYMIDCDTTGQLLLFINSYTCNATEDTPVQVSSFCLSTIKSDFIACCGNLCTGAAHDQTTEATIDKSQLGEAESNEED